MTKFQIISTKYKNLPNGPCVTIYGRDQQGNAIQHDITGFKPYFFVLPKDFKIVESLLNDLPEVTEYYHDYKYLPSGYQQDRTEVLQIYVKRPGDVPKIRDTLRNHPSVIDVYEADILYATARFLTNHDLFGMGWAEANGNDIKPLHNIKENAPLRFLGTDIEVLPPERNVPVAQVDPIIIISLSFNIPYKGHKSLVLVARNGTDFGDVKYLNDERSVLTTFLQIIQDYDPDIMLDFNGSIFDLPYIETRLNMLSISNNMGRDQTPFVIKEFGSKKEVNIVGRACADLIDLIKLNYSLTSYSLDNVSKVLLNRPKLDIKASAMRRIWLEGSHQELTDFISYAARDADLLLDIVNELKLIDRYIALSRECGLLLHEVINGGQSRRIESMLLREFYKEGRLFPLKPKTLPKDVDVEGATVFEPDRGLHENLIVMDYKSLYPSAVRAFNICWTSILNEDIPSIKAIVAPNNVKYVDHSVYEGLMPRILTRLYNKRVELKTLMKMATTKSEKEFYDNQQYSVKILLNSFYGYTGAMTSRFCDARLANSITSVGRMAIKLTKETAESLAKCKVVGGDTDSVFIKLFEQNDPDSAKRVATIIHDEMVRKLPHPMEIDFECFVKRGIIFEKKRYAMYIFEQSKDGWKDKYKYRGIETRRKDWVPLVGDTMEKVLELILKEDRTRDAWEYTDQIINKIRSLQDIRTDPEFAQKLILSRKLGKIDGYKNPQPHLTTYNKMVSRGEQPPGLGDRVQYYAIPGAMKDGISLCADSPDYVISTGGRIDNEWYIHHQVMPALERVFSVMNIDINTGKRIQVASDLFGFSQVEKSKEIIQPKKTKTGLFSFT